jgi:pilus assembly protein Flp/PilA
MVKEKTMIEIFASAIRDEGGAAMVEYGLLVALIALVAITGVTVLGTSLQALFNNAAGSI